MAVDTVAEDMAAAGTLLAGGMVVTLLAVILVDAATGTADVAVHSLKDLPTTHVAGLTLAAVPPRGPTGDVFV